MPIKTTTRSVSEFDVVAESGQRFRVHELVTVVTGRDRFGRPVPPAPPAVAYRAGDFEVQPVGPGMFDVLTPAGPVRCWLVQ